jgi:hypothetical protein
MNWQEEISDITNSSRIGFDRRAGDLREILLEVVVEQCRYADDCAEFRIFARNPSP